MKSGFIGAAFFGLAGSWGCGESPRAEHVERTGAALVGHAVATYDASGSVAGVAVADVDADGVPDVVTANGLDHSISVLRGDGHGGFVAPDVYPLGSNPSVLSLAVADLDADGAPDLAVVLFFDPDTVRLLFNDGTGRFVAGPLLDMGRSSFPNLVKAVAAGDLNGDGAVDLVTADSGPSDVAVFIGDGTGQFSQALRYPMGDNATGSCFGTFTDCLMDVRLADLDGDGRLDVLVANANVGVGNDDDVIVRLGAGDGTFGPEIATGTAGRSVHLDVGDLDGDGRPDLAVANRDQGDVVELLGDGSGAFVRATSAFSDHPEDVVIEDLDRDGVPEVSWVVFDDNSLQIARLGAAGSFVSTQTFAVGAEPRAIAAGDFDGNGLRDLVAGNSAGRSITVVRTVVLDSDGDGIPDVRDPSTVADVVRNLGDAALGSHGQRNAMLSILASIEADVAAGDLDAAVQRLRNLRAKVDGCDPAAGDPIEPDHNDWITDCSDQDVIRALIDGLIAALTS